MHDISNRFILSKRIGVYRTYLRSIREREYVINGNIEYIYVLKGSIFVENNNKTVPLNKEDVYVVEPWKDIVIHSDTDNIILVLQIIPECLEKYHLVNYKYIYTGIALSQVIRGRIIGNIRILLGHKLEGRYNNEIILKAIESLIDDVKIDLDIESINVDRGDTTMKSIIVDITRELPSRVINGKDTTLKALSNKYNISYYHLSKKFKDITGITYTNYISNIQMNIFLDMLINEDYNITTIALKSGYKNISNLNKDFKKTFNMSPTELRRRYREDSYDPTFKIKEVKDFLGEVNMLENYYLNGEILVDFRTENQFTNRSMDLEDIKATIVRVKSFINNFENTQVRLVINYADYRYVLALEDEELTMFLSSKVKEIIDICLDRQIELTVEYKI